MNLKPYNFGLLKSILSKFKDRYDVVFIDTPPTESSLTIFSIAASTHALVPLQVDKKALDSLDLTVNEILTVKEAVNPNLVFLGILPTLYYGRAAVSKFVLKKIQQDYGDHVLPVVIKYKALYKEASLASQPVAFYLKKHDNEDYYKLFKILQERIC
jgi:chromosome partitioning protein